MIFSPLVENKEFYIVCICLTFSKGYSDGVIGYYIQLRMDIIILPYSFSVTFDCQYYLLPVCVDAMNFYHLFKLLILNIFI